MAEKIQLIVENYNKTSENCINYVDRFNWEDIAQEYIKIYKENGFYKE